MQDEERTDTPGAEPEPEPGPEPEEELTPEPTPDETPEPIPEPESKSKKAKKYRKNEIGSIALGDEFMLGGEKYRLKGIEGETAQVMKLKTVEIPEALVDMPADTEIEPV